MHRNAGLNVGFWIGNKRIAYGDNDGSNLFKLPDTLPKDKGLYVPIAVTAAVGGGTLLIALAATVTALTLKHVKKKKKAKAEE